VENILIAEDDIEIRTGIKYILVEKGFNVIEAEDGQKALDILNKEKIDLIISDIMMPVKNGYDLLMDIKKDELLSAIPFLFLTAKTSYDDFRLGMNLGVDDYISKPFKAIELLQAIDTRLKKKNEIEKKFERLKSGITKYVPHELRTPLVSIIGFSDMILTEYKENTPGELTEMVQRINVAGNRLLRTIEKFLIFTELKSSVKFSSKTLLEKEISDFSISRIFEDVREKLNKIYQSKITFNNTIIEKSLMIPENYFQILITEVVDNALKFSSSCGIVNINTGIENNFYTIEISNNGKKFAADQIRRISEFVQFDRDEFQQNGNGLGLTIVKSILNSVGGTVEIQSDGSSTNVKISIPLLNEAEQ